MGQEDQLARLHLPECQPDWREMNWPKGAGDAQTKAGRAVLSLLVERKEASVIHFRPVPGIPGNLPLQKTRVAAIPHCKWTRDQRVHPARERGNITSMGSIACPSCPT